MAGCVDAMTRVVTFVVFLSLLALTTAASELFFAEQLIEHYGKNDGLQVTGLKNLIAAAGARGNASDGDHHGMECAGKSWISNTTCLKNMVGFIFLLFVVNYLGTFNGALLGSADVNWPCCVYPDLCFAIWGRFVFKTKNILAQVH